MAKCQFDTHYYDYEKREEVTYTCPEKDQRYIHKLQVCAYFMTNTF